MLTPFFKILIMLIEGNFSGHLLFEMMCGYELTTLSPSNSDLANVKSDEQVEV